MTLVRWQPRYHGFWGLQRDMNRLFDDVLGAKWGRGEDRDWVPTVDVEERENEFVVSLDVPGVDKKDVKVALEDNILTIRGERKVERSENEGTYHCTERCFGTFQRSFTLPRTIDSSKIHARHKDGVLTVTLPKAEEAKEREIQIDVK